MTNVRKLVAIPAPDDDDAIFIKARIAEADNADNEAESKTTRAAAARIEAGQRLIEVKNRMGPDTAVSGPIYHTGWKVWLEDNGIPHTTATRLMKLAGFTEEQRTEAKAKEAKRKRESRKPKNALDAASKALQAAGEEPLSREETIALKGKGSIRRVVGDDVDLRDAANAAPVVDAVLAKRAESSPVSREDLSLSMQQRYDRALAKALADQHKEQEATFWAKVREEVKQRLPKEKADALQAIKDYGLKMKGVASQMSLDDYRFVCRVLHPDRQPSEDERAKAFAIVRKLDEYVTVANR